MAKKSSVTPDAVPNSQKLIVFFPENAVKKELASVPDRHRDRFINSLMLLSQNQLPTCNVKPLGSQGHGVYELVINGRPAWRCIYTTNYEGKIVVVHATEKTTDGHDRQIANVVRERLKSLAERESGK